MKGDFSEENDARKSLILVNQWHGMPSDVRRYKWIFNKKKIQQKCKILMKYIKQYISSITPWHLKSWKRKGKETNICVSLDWTAATESSEILLVDKRNSDCADRERHRMSEFGPMAADPPVVCQSCREMERFTDYFSWETERERENNLIPKTLSKRRGGGAQMKTRSARLAVRHVSQDNDNSRSTCATQTVNVSKPLLLDIYVMS